MTFHPYWMDEHVIVCKCGGSAFAAVDGANDVQETELACVNCSKLYLVSSVNKTNGFIVIRPTDLRYITYSSGTSYYGHVALRDSSVLDMMVN